MLKSKVFLFAATLLPLAAQAPTPSAADIDPAALNVLRAVTNAIKCTDTYSFRARVSRDRLGTNGQIITYFRDNHITVHRPDKLYINVDGEHQDVEFFYNGREATLYDPAQKLYTSLPAAKTIDATLDVLEKRGIQFPTSNLLRSDPYHSLVDGLTGAYVIGRVNIDGQTFHHLAFTEPDADWQLWVRPGKTPLPRRVEIVYKTQPGSPRVSIDLSEWNFSPNVNASLFTFQKPAGAQEIGLLPTSQENQRYGD